MPDATLVAQYIVNGIVLGSIIALAAIGLTLVYGILNLSNFAQGDFVTMGALFAFFLAATHLGDLATWTGAFGLVVLGAVGLERAFVRRLTRGERFVALAYGAALLLATALLLAFPPGTRSTNLALFAATLAGAGGVAALSVALDFGVWGPLRRKRATALTLIIVSIGVALVARNTLQLVFGADVKSFTRVVEVSARIGGVSISTEQQFTLLVAVALSVALHLFLKRTRTGKAMRALSDNMELARSSGIDVDRLIKYLWAIGGALAGIAGVLLALVSNNTIHVNMGAVLLLPLFAAVILGGVGSPYGAIVGGLVVGIAMQTSALWLGTAYDRAMAFILLIVILLVRPQGLFGGKIS